ncbi:MAG TPA: hypothetical protein VF017_13125 [Thermoanaerobaculia bacterium]|nr:hypothetical protein [Thermoanaerobaculia bacterium]
MRQRDFVVLLLGLVVVALSKPAVASDPLYGVVFDVATTSEGLVTIDPVTAALGAVGAGIPGCCLVSSGVSSFDPESDRFFFVGFFQADPPNTTRLFVLDATTGAVTSNAILPAGKNYNFIEWDHGTDRLLGVVFDVATTTEQLVEIDPATAALTPIGAGIPACCLIPSGVSSFDPDNGVFFFVGSFQADPPGTSRLFRFDGATGAVLGNPLLPAGKAYNFIEHDEQADTLYAVVFDFATTTEQLTSVDAAAGTLTPVGPGIPGCCLVSNGVSSFDPNDGTFYFIGFFQADPPSSWRIFSLDTATGTVLGNPILPAGKNYNFIEVDRSFGPPPPTTVTIDVKPGSFPNSVNPRSKGVVPVAVLTTASFDALTVDVATVRFSGAGGAPEAHGRGHRQDVDGDGDLDLVLHFRTRRTGIQCGDTSATLVGSTLGGDPIEGTDSIKTVGCH